MDEITVVGDLNGHLKRLANQPEHSLWHCICCSTMLSLAACGGGTPTALYCPICRNAVTPRMSLMRLIAGSSDAVRSFWADRWIEKNLGCDK